MELYAIWFASIIGAGIFFLAGVVAGKKRKLQNAATAQTEGIQSDQVMQMQDLHLSHQNQIEAERIKQVEASETAAVQYQQLRADYTKNFSDIEQQLKNTEVKHQKAQAELQQVQLKHQKIQVEHQKAQAESQKARAENQKAQVENQKAQAEHQKVQAENQKTQVEQQRAQAESQKTQARNSAGQHKTEQALVQAQSKLKLLQEKTSELEDVVQHSEAQQRRLEATLQERQNLSHQGSDELAATRSMVQQLQSDIEEVQEKYEEGKSLLRSVYAENELLRGKVFVGEQRQTEVMELRTQLTTAQSNEEQIAELTQQVAGLKAQNIAVAAPLASSPIQVDSNLESTTRERLHGVIDFLVQKSKGNAIVIADDLGLPIVTQGDHGLELAALGSMVSAFALKAHDLMPVGKADHVDFVDKNGTSISFWPFRVDTDELLLITLNNSKSESSTQMKPTFRGAIGNIVEILQDNV